VLTVTSKLLTLRHGACGDVRVLPAWPARGIGFTYDGSRWAGLPLEGKRPALGRRVRGQVFVYGGLQDRVCGVEVPVGEVVAYTGDLPLRDR
jgi:hypothetical protein